MSYLYQYSNETVQVRNTNVLMFEMIHVRSPMEKYDFQIPIACNHLIDRHTPPDKIHMIIRKIIRVMINGQQAIDNSLSNGSG